MEAAGVELFGSLRLACGGKHGYAGVRGRQGKKRDRFQAYITIDGEKMAVAGLFASAHEAAVARAQHLLQRELGFEDEPTEKKPRKRRRSKAAEDSAAAAGSTSSSGWSRLPLQPLIGSSAQAAPAVPTALAHPLPPSMAMAGFPVALAQPVREGAQCAESEWSCGMYSTGCGITR